MVVFRNCRSTTHMAVHYRWMKLGWLVAGLREPNVDGACWPGDTPKRLTCPYVSASNFKRISQLLMAECPQDYHSTRPRRRGASQAT